ncbi:unnamed protein product [Ostreobium quekettii]|uniref:Uncharacterized protein n=1 Tax=Ostreobium quekettii TaxID=121088 RepID=A0A8S1IS39_9CHLO|nr:unnamed protein product [Ostreobium quekettii]|eukprot:evm.model.scf_629EXC.2 EVM.evm.TU.scf_629EXC.2   scf_629EXC:21060-22069(-)
MELDFRRVQTDHGRNGGHASPSHTQWARPSQLTSQVAQSRRSVPGGPPQSAAAASGPGARSTDAGRTSGQTAAGQAGSPWEQEDVGDVLEVVVPRGRVVDVSGRVWGGPQDLEPLVPFGVHLTEFMRDKTEAACLQDLEAEWLRDDGLALGDARGTGEATAPADRRVLCQSGEKRHRDREEGELEQENGQADGKKMHKKKHKDKNKKHKHKTNASCLGGF